MCNKVISLMNKINPEDIVNSTVDVETYKCPECKKYEKLRINGELICKNCGLVLAGPSYYVGIQRIDYPFGLNLFIDE